jgi:hypothetical protein
VVVVMMVHLLYDTFDDCGVALWWCFVVVVLVGCDA